MFGFDESELRSVAPLIAKDIKAPLDLKGGWDLFKKNTAEFHPKSSPSSAEEPVSSPKKREFGDGFETKELSARWTLVYSIL